MNRHNLSNILIWIAAAWFVLLVSAVSLKVVLVFIHLGVPTVAGVLLVLACVAAFWVAQAYEITVRRR